MRFFVFLFLNSCLLLVSCKEKKTVVGLMFPHTTMKRYLIEKEVITKKISEAGGEVIFEDANKDEQKQLEQFDELINKVDILILDPVNRFNAAQMVRKAHEHGIKVISYDRLISNADVDAFVTFDPKLIGKQMTEFALNIKPSGNYVIIGGDKMDLNAIGIDEGQQLALDKYIKEGKIHVLYRTFIEQWSEEEAKFEVERFLKLSNQIPDVILASADGVSAGVVKAIKDRHLEGKIIITGNGGEVANCKYILQGLQTMTVYKPVKKLADLSADLALKMLKGEDVSNILNTNVFNGLVQVPSNLLGTIPVDSSNLRSKILADGIISEEELKNN